MLRLVFHGASAAMFCATLWYDIHYIDLGAGTGWDVYGGKLRFLTFINLCVHALFYVICTFYDLARFAKFSPKRLQAVRRLKDHLFTVLVFPVGAFVVLMFWGIYAVDRELIFPQFLDKIFPAWANHVMHSVILPVNLLEMALDYHTHPVPRWSGLKHLVGFSLAYQAWTLWVYLKTSSWIYPIFNALNGWQKVAFLQSATVIILLLYFVGEFLQQKVFKAKKAVMAEVRPGSPKKFSSPTHNSVKKPSATNMAKKISVNDGVQKSPSKNSVKKTA